MEQKSIFSPRNRIGLIAFDSLRKHAYSNILKILPPENENLR